MKTFKVLLSFLFLLFVSLPAGASPGAADSELIEIEVSSGDTLSIFARRYLDEPERWPELLEYNELPTGDPDLIYPGDVIRVPMEMVRDEIADFIRLQNQVRMRKSGDQAWRQAVVGVRLYPNDGIRTSADSSASIEYLASDSYANIGENSLVFLRPEPVKDDVVSLDVGQLRARDVKVLTDTAVIDPEKGSDYKAEVDEQQTTTLSVFRGSVDLISAGEKVTVEEGFMSRAERDAPPESPVELPDPPEMEGQDISPGDEASRRHAYSDIDESFFLDSLRMDSERMQREDIQAIIVQVAPDEDFSKLLIDRKVDRAAPENFKQELSDGEYFWRCAFVDSRGTVSRFSRAQRFTVDTKPPEIEIYHPESGAEIRGRITTIQGWVSPGASVEINGDSVIPDSEGNFIYGLNLKHGENEINLKASDNYGRVSEKEIILNSVLIEEKEKKGEILSTAGIVASVLGIVAIAAAIIR
ncbi:MAG: LysM peptidoglycan-binding domain-containing protein [Elusimicrobiota bacterium]